MGNDRVDTHKPSFSADYFYSTFYQEAKKECYIHIASNLFTAYKLVYSRASNKV